MTRPHAFRRAPFAAAAASAGLLLAGCSGLGGNSSLTCKLPDGAHCDSVSNTYAESTRGELPGQRKRQATGEAAPSGTTSQPRSDGGPVMQIDPRMMPVGMPLRSQARVVRLWIKAWEDADGDLHDQSFVYLPVTEGRWLVEHKQREARNAYAPVRTSASRTPAPPAARPPSLPPAPGASPAPAAQPSAAGKPSERMNEAVQRARSQQPANSLVRTEGGRSGS